MTDLRRLATGNLMALGFTEREADFLTFVGTHTGVFTMGNWRSYRGNVTTRGAADARFLDKLDKYRFVTRVRVSTMDFIRLTSKRFYAHIGEPNSHLRKPLSNRLLRRRLLCLDYLVQNWTHRFLQSEQEKIDFFTHGLNIPLRLLPSTTYRAKTGSSTTTRYFVDRYPIFIEEHGDAEAPTVGIVYAQDPVGPFESFRRFMHTNRHFFSHIPSLHIVYLTPHLRRNALAEGFLSSFATGLDETSRLLRYFRIRQLADRKEMSSLTPDDIHFWREATMSFAHRRDLDDAYQHFQTQGNLSPSARCALRSCQMTFDVRAPTSDAWALASNDRDVAVRM